MTKLNRNKTYVLKTPSLNCSLMYVFAIIPDSRGHEHTGMNTHTRARAPHTPQTVTHTHTDRELWTKN